MTSLDLAHPFGMQVQPSGDSADKETVEQHAPNLPSPDSQESLPEEALCADRVRLMLRHLQSLTALNEHGQIRGVIPVARATTDDTDMSNPCHAREVTLRTLGRQVIRTARSRITTLQRRVEAAQLQVLINDWTVAERIWTSLVPDLRAPVIEISFLRELWGSRMDEVGVPGESMWSLVGRIGVIQAEVELSLFRRRDIVELSSVFECRLAPWLEELADFLEQMYALDWR